MQPFKITHVALTCSDLNKTLVFYERVLDLKVTKRWGTGDQTICMASFADGTSIEIFAGGKPLPKCSKGTSGVFPHLAIEVENADAAFDLAVENGAQVKLAPQDMDLPSEPVLPIRVAFVYGPDGEILEFFQQRR